MGTPMKHPTLEGNPANTSRSFPHTYADGHVHKRYYRESPYTRGSALARNCGNCTNMSVDKWWECNLCGHVVCVWCRAHSEKDLGEFIQEKQEGGKGRYYVSRKYQ